jgi:hypothetical protein
MWLLTSAIRLFWLIQSHMNMLLIEREAKIPRFTTKESGLVVHSRHCVKEAVQDA